MSLPGLRTNAGVMTWTHQIVYHIFDVSRMRMRICMRMRTADCAYMDCRPYYVLMKIHCGFNFAFLLSVLFNSLFI